LKNNDIQLEVNDIVEDAERTRTQKIANRFSNVISSRRSKIFMLFAGIMLLPWGIFAMVHWEDITDVRHVEDLGDKLEFIGGIGLGYIVIFGFAFIAISIFFVLVFCAGFVSYFRKLSVESEKYVKPAIYNLISIIPIVWLLAWIVYIDEMSLTLLVVISWALLLLAVVERPLNKWNQPMSLIQMFKKRKNGK